MTSGILAALLEEESGDACEGRREEDLDGGQGGDGTGVALHPGSSIVVPMMLESADARKIAGEYSLSIVTNVRTSAPANAG